MIVADENVDAPVVAALRAAGHEVQAIAEREPSAKDEAVLLRAVLADAVLVTLDRDFGELIFHKGHQPPRAVIYVRSKGMDLAAIGAALVSALRDATVDGLHVTIDRNGRRDRPLPFSGENNG